MRKSNKFIVWMIVLATIILILFLIIMGRNNIVEYVTNYTNSLVTANVISCLNSASIDSVNKYDNLYKDFLYVEYKEDNTINIMTVNMLYINRLQREMAELSLQYLVEYCNSHLIYIPSGAVLGSVLFSGRGKNISVDIIPVGTTETQYRIEYESVGINSTRYSLYIDILANVKIVVPFYTNDVKVSTSVLVVESIIQGEVPPYIIS